MNKRGVASHIEVIFAFILFISFIAGAVYFINPTTSDQSAEIATKYALERIIDNSSTQLIRYSFVVTDSSPNSSIFNLSSSYSTLDAIAKKEDGTVLPSYRSSGNSICVNLTGDNFTSIELSDAFNSNTYSISNCQNNGYRVASITSEKVISEKKMMALYNLYNSDYKKTKEIIGIPTTNDFSFYLVYGLGGGIEAKSNSTGISKYAYERTVRVAAANGEIKFGVLRVIVW